ncbi:MAG: hypothetical protein JWN68_2885 [Nocardioides sp.]|nr:hypothetical protein [Nocardioides sp.]
MTDPKGTRMPMAPVIPIRRPVPAASVQGSLALHLTPRLDPPETRPATACQRRIDVVSAEPGERMALDRFAHAFLVRATEVASGDRPVTQLLRQSAPRVYEDLARRARLVSAAAGTLPSRGRGRGAVRPVLRTMRTSLVSAGALEASAHVRYGARSRAIAARFEVLDGRWQCVALEWA